MLLKICGITDPDIAQHCLELGADMIGLVYYPPSPRHVGIQTIQNILDAVEPFRQRGRKTVLVVVNSLPAEIDRCIDFVQLHGTLEPSHLSSSKIRVVKDRQTFDRLIEFPDEPMNTDQPVEFVLEMSHGILPGGNGATWDWSLAEPFCRRYKTLLAGGISPDNICEAIEQAKPAGIDVSSGVETSPGVKDYQKIERLIRKLKRYTV